jgi:tRNA dimethylallyltransferase
MSERFSILVIVGPTAAGKTALSIQLAEALGGEIVSADSRQIYRHMDIGTAKATPPQRATVPHHLIDVVDPDQTLTLADYQQMALAALNEIHSRGRLPMLVGGTGQYIQAIIEGWGIPRVAPQPELRSRLEEDAAEQGSLALHQRLAVLDPIAAGRIDHRNVRRVIRALEVCLVTGTPISEQQRKTPPSFQTLQLGVARPHPELYRRIDERVDEMMREGLLGEVEQLVAQGYGWGLPAMSGLGYRQVGQFLRGEMSLADAVAQIKQKTRRFVHQQGTWFANDDPAIHWLNPATLDLPQLLVELRTQLTLEE